jgi:hypothetical protein
MVKELIPSETLTSALLDGTAILQVTGSLDHPTLGGSRSYQGMSGPREARTGARITVVIGVITAYRHNESGGPEVTAGRAAWESEMGDRAVQTALQRHWDASDASDFKTEHEIYHEDAVLDYPQSGERIRGRHNIQESRTVQPNKKRFTIRRIIGSGDLWVTEFVLTYDGIPSYTVSIMEFRQGLVAHETQYFADRFDPAPSRAHLVERAGAS